MHQIHAQVISDLFKAGTDFANLGILGILAVATLALAWFAWRAYEREARRADAAADLAVSLSDQFDRALDILERQSHRRRNGDAG